MIRVSSSVHGASSPFKHDSIGISVMKVNSPQNGKYRKQVYKCNGQIDVQSNSTSPRFNNAQKIRFSPNPKSNIQRHSAFKEPQLKISDSSDPIAVANLFAGSKFCVTPSPLDLPKPPQSWTNVAVSSENVPLDLTHDSAVLVVGTENNRLFKLNSIMK